MVKVTVIGAGKMGVKIAGDLAYHGHEVRIFDHNPESLNKVQLKLKEDKKMLAEDGVLVASNFMGKVYCISRLEDAVKSSDFIFEAVPDDLSLKQDLFERISRCCKSDAVIATNSLKLNCDVAERAVHKERCLGVRFLFPVYCIPEVEIVPYNFTSVATLEKVRKFLEGMGKVAFLRSGNKPLILNDSQREKKRGDFIRHLNRMSLNPQKLKFKIPDLGNEEVVTKGISLALDNASSREKDCVICMDKERNYVLHPCHHLCTCSFCSKTLLKRRDACPICRQPITSVFRVFQS